MNLTLIIHENMLVSIIYTDTPSNRKMLSMLLRSKDIESDAAVNGQMAVDAFKADPSKYKLIFMDYTMPVMVRSQKNPALLYTYLMLQCTTVYYCVRTVCGRLICILFFSKYASTYLRVCSASHILHLLY